MNDRPRPQIDNAPGLSWRRLQGGWEARWRPRGDLVRRGYEVTTQRLWMGWELNPITTEFIQGCCRRLQDEMLIWAAGGSLPPIAGYDGTIFGLIRAYKTDPDSGFHRLRYQTKINYERQMAVIDRDHGSANIAEIRAREMKRWHEAWMAPSTEGGRPRVTMAHDLIGIMRTMMTFGATMLECEHCRAVKTLLHDMRFQQGKPRTERLVAEHATIIRAQAHEAGVPSIALAQSIQFEGMFRQKDIIGEWVPLAEPGISDVTDGNSKWLHGIRWEKLDEQLVLRHTTSKRQKDHEVDLKLAPMVLEELEGRYPGLIVRKDGEIVLVNRHLLPAKGPIIVRESNGLPWPAAEFRRRWRLLADKGGVPKAVKNMDSRAGAISEATDSGADLESVRHAATHGDIAMTQRYSRNQRGKTDDVMQKRVEYRNKQGTAQQETQQELDSTHDTPMRPKSIA